MQDQFRCEQDGRADRNQQDPDGDGLVEIRVKERVDRQGKRLRDTLKATGEQDGRAELTHSARKAQAR